MRKYELTIKMAEQEAMISELEYALAQCRAELGQIKNTIIRVNISTENGVRPIYQAELTYAILATKMAGGGGILPSSAADAFGLRRDELPQLVEVVSEWQPPHMWEPGIDRLEMDEATLPEPNFYESDYPGRDG